MKITVLTAVYNRKEKIKKLYDSLVKQTSKNFEWLIVDDGSTDDLKSWIDKTKKEKNIDIRYLYQENGGKHRAINKGVANIENEITLIIDSDDYLDKNAIKTIEEYHEKYKDDKSICGFCFLRAFPDGKINGKRFIQDEYKSDYYTCRVNGKILDDKAEVYYTKCLKEYPFIEIEGEKFLSEGYSWALMGLKYNMIFINKVLYYGDYLDDGLSKKSFIKKYESPIGFAEKSKVLCNKRVNFVKRCKSMVLYIAYSKIGKRKFIEQYKNVDYKVLFISMYLFGLIYKIRVDYKIKKEK